ncbi:NADH:ubiquinone oxidoreductase 18 kd-like subunit [Dunaliella salina]|uniref:NADH dehydrogenase [ubiquinone] iron-sulfur protein 4, mitochondrial n=1 Tax=Dunaliella salina TaxID=3046 RepID=A0ABQ7G6T3_DUNSA|nr:NADH:ubiquinone oxidoreductase 18 kd-like subunit [Dunaliella salina]|eukprot:KAF5830307.1 NADH:ubiquinone oxidoreductase 18 kd-like subunit [Dunaliella salina]
MALLRSFRSLLPSSSALPEALRSFATDSSSKEPPKKQAQPDDYSLVMKKAGEVSAKVQRNPPEKEVGLVTGAPLEVFKRQAYIYAPAKTASQSGRAKTIHNSSASPSWKIDFDVQEKWQNPLMGWTSTGDLLENVARSHLAFYTKEEAINFCQKHGWDYFVSEPNQGRLTRQKRFTGYGDNFSIKRAGLPDLSHLPSNASSKR